MLLYFWETFSNNYRMLKGEMTKRLTKSPLTEATSEHAKRLQVLETSTKPSHVSLKPTPPHVTPRSLSRAPASQIADEHGQAKKTRPLRVTAQYAEEEPSAESRSTND